MGLGMQLGGAQGGRGSVLGLCQQDVEVDCPCALVTITLGLHDVALGLSSLVNNNPWYILLISRVPKQHFMTRD